MEYSASVYALFLISVFSNAVLCISVEGKMRKSDVTSMSDASDITWAHAVNSRDRLEKELNGTVDFIEADVSLGLVKGNQFGTFIPIMAHPPDTFSDISLDDWLAIVINRDTGKGLKLDFKSMDVVEPSLTILQMWSKQFNFTLWLNADILRGPIHASRMPVKDDMFLLLCQQYFPGAVLSVGWTTEWLRTFPPETWHYDWQHVREMADIIRCFGYENSYPNFTFPVRGIFASRSIKQLQWLLRVVPNSSLTVWTGASDPLEINDLLEIRKAFPKDKVYYDVPQPLYELFLKMKNSVSYVVESASTFSDEQWMTLTRGLGPQCSSSTYISNDTIMFGKSLHTAVLLKKLLVADLKRSVKIQGRLEFFSDYEAMASVTLGNNQVSIMIVDVSLFSKNSTPANDLDLAGSDSEVIWSALNASHLYTFDQKPSNLCRMFKLNTSDVRSFQAWTVHCDDLRDGKSFEEIVANGVQEVPFTKRLVLPEGPFMIGFVSVGDDYAVIHDFTLEEKEDGHSVNAASVIEISLGVLSIVFISFVMHRFFT